MPHFVRRITHGARRALAAVGACAMLLCGQPPATGAEVRLKSGLIVEGYRLDAIKGLTARTISQREGDVGAPTMLMVNAGPKRYYIGNKQIVERIFDAPLARYETFSIKQIHTGKKKMVASLGSFTQVEPFAKTGHRTVSIRTDRGPDTIVQGITDINPKYVRIEGLTHEWELAIATTSIPPDELDAILRNITDQRNSNDRLAIARFYLQAEMYRQANAELDSIIRDFPELKQATEPTYAELRQLQAKELLAELKRRRSAGQDQLALDAIQKFPTEGMGAEVLREVREMQAEYDEIEHNIDRAISLLSDLQAELKDSKQIDAVGPMRSTIADALDRETLGRLDAFLKLADDPTLKADEKLAFAYTGWALGSNNASRDLDEAIRIWDARFLAGEYLRSDDARTRSELMNKLRSVESVGPNRILQMIPLLPMPFDDSMALPGEARTVETRVERGAAEATYSILLPPEYTPNRVYPLIVALRPAERSALDMLTWWGGTREQPGQSQRHGYIVIAPHYAKDEARQYEYDVESHRIVRDCITDARKRFNIDSDRIFLTGHGMGGDAAFDIGMSHPDLFAGLMPIAGISQNQCSTYWTNAKDLPMYIVGGQLDRDSFDRNAETGKVDRMITRGYDVMYCDYIGRGYESYYEEIFKLFEWMAIHRRAKQPKEFEMKTSRPSESQFYWVEGQGLPFGTNKRGRATEITFFVKATPNNNTIWLRTGAKRHIVWLSPEIVDFDQRVAIQYRGFRRFYDFVKPDVETILEDVRTRGDRQRIYSARLEIE
jgi:enterochelin esterase-like enzyme